MKYEFTDVRPQAGLNYYRLKMIDQDGKFNYSPIIRVQLNSILAVMNIYNNPTSNDLVAQHPTTLNQATLTITNSWKIFDFY